MSKNYLKDELKNFGPVVLLNYGSGSVKRCSTEGRLLPPGRKNGIYDQVVAILKEAGKTIVENPGVMSNPTLENWMLEIGLPQDNKKKTQKNRQH